MKENNHENLRKLVGTALFTAIVVVLQLLGSFIHFGRFSVSLVLVPIVLGAALYGVEAGAWLGFAFGATVLLSGDAAPFLEVTVLGTVITVLGKGFAAGLGAGVVYNLARKRSESLAVTLSAIVCPILNTGVFILGCFAFFLPTLREWGASEFGEDVVKYIFVGMVGINFIAEFVFNIVLCPVIVRLIRVGQNGLHHKAE